MSALNYGIQLAEGVVKGVVDALNSELATQGESTFVFDVKDMPLNFTMTRFPEFS